jgi:sirohydrochlorin ferrochelatase
LLLIAHGSREAEANADLYHIADGLRRRGPFPVVEGSFLELAGPTGDEAGDRCVAQGAGRVIILPYFLSAGVHVRRDLAALRLRLADRHPEVEFRLAEPLGRHPLLLDVVADRVREADALGGTPGCQVGTGFAEVLQPGPSTGPGAEAGVVLAPPKDPT